MIDKKKIVSLSGLEKPAFRPSGFEKNPQDVDAPDPTVYLSKKKKGVYQR